MKRQVAGNAHLHSPGSSSSRLPSLFIFGIYTVLTLILTYPLVFNFTTAVPNDIGDPLLNTWILAWDSHAMLTDPLNLFKANIFYPLPNTLAYSEHLFSTALLTLPLQLVTGEPLVAYNLGLFLTFPVAALGMYLLALHWTHQRRAAFIAGLIFAFAPYRFAAVAHLQLLTFQWLPFILLFLDRILNQPTSQRPPARYLFGLTIFLVLQILASWYLALYTALIVALYLVAALLSRRRSLSRLLALLPVILLSILLILPFMLPYLSLIDDLQQARPLSLALSLAAAPTDFAAAAPFNRLIGPLTEPFRSRPYFTEENTLFAGLMAPLLALAILLAMASAYVLRGSPTVDSHGKHGIDPLRPARRGAFTRLRPLPVFILFAILIGTLLLTFPRPYALLAAIFPLSTIVRVPPRWVIPALFALSGLAAFGFAMLNSHFTLKNSKFIMARLFFAVIVSVLLLETLSIPLPLAQVDNHNALNPAYHWLAKQPDHFALIELPLHSAPEPEFPEVKRLYASTLGWWPLVNGYSGYTPPRQPRLARALSNFPDQESIDALQAIVPTSIPHGEPPRPLLLLVHPGEAPLDRPDWETMDRWQAERNPALFPLGQFGGDYLYQLRSLDPRLASAPPLATFGDAQSIRLMALKLVSSPASPSQPGDREDQVQIQPVDPAARASLILYWQSAEPLPIDYTVFIHGRAPDGFIHAQADSPPVDGHYPTGAWPPGQIIQDIHPLPAPDFSRIDHLAVGLYDPLTDARLPAFDPTGERLADDSFIIPLK